MSREYAMSRVQDALSSCNGNATQAQRLLMGWIEKDQTLLLGLVGPHIKSIVIHAISHAVNKDKEPKKKLDLGTEEIGDFGHALLENVLGRGRSSSAPDGPPAPPAGVAAARPVKASNAHVSAMQALAGKSTKPTDTTGKKKK